MESSPNDRILMPAASHASELASGLAQEKQEEAAAARLEAALSFDRPPTPSPSPTQPSVAKDPGHITLPAPSSGAAVAAGRAAEQEEARKGASMEKALEIARGPPVTPERMGIKSEPATVPLGASTADRRTPIAKLDASLAHYDSINALEARTHIPKSYMAIAALSIVGASVATGLGVKATTAIFSLAFPTIHLADLAKRGDVESEWKQWMVYFAVASWLNALDHFLGPVLLRVLPSFYLLKVIYLRWLGAVPGYNGGANVYKSLFSQT